MCVTVDGGGSRFSTGMALLEGVHGINVPRHKCIAHCSPVAAGEWTNAFAAARNNNAMRPLVELIWTLVFLYKFNARSALK